MERIIKSMSKEYLDKSLNLVEKVFTEFENAEEGRIVRALVEEIRNKKYYLPELEFIMVDENDEVIGYVMFSKFYLKDNGVIKYEDELLILTPAAVKTSLQRQHISKELIEYGFKRAKELGYKAVLVEGNPKNYNPRGFKTAADYGIVAGESVHLPRVECLMVKELEEGVLEYIKGRVEYDFYEALMAGE